MIIKIKIKLWRNVSISSCLKKIFKFNACKIDSFSRLGPSMTIIETLAIIFVYVFLLLFPYLFFFRKNLTFELLSLVGRKKNIHECCELIFIYGNGSNSLMFVQLHIFSKNKCF